MTEAFRQPKNSVTAEAVISSNELYFSELPICATHFKCIYQLLARPGSAGVQLSSFNTCFPLDVIFPENRILLTGLFQFFLNSYLH